MSAELRISWSQLRTHGECKQRSHLLRTGHGAPTKNLRGYFHGMVVDTAMRRFLADPAPGLMGHLVDDLIDSTEAQARESGDGVVRWRGPGDRAQLAGFCRELVARLEPILREHVLPYPFTVGYRFAHPVALPPQSATPPTITLVGEMDLLVHRPEGHVVWDLKATRDDGYWRKVAGQLVFYDLAVLCRYGTPTLYTGLIQPMCTQQVLVLRVGEQERRVMWTRVLGLVADIVAGHAPCAPGTEPCRMCEVRHACPRYRPDALAGTDPPTTQQAP